MYLDNYHYYLMARVQHYLSVASSDPDDGSDACSSCGVANVTLFSFHILTRFFISSDSSFRASSYLSASFPTRSSEVLSLAHL
jgi:hypothetical protein